MSFGCTIETLSFVMFTHWPHSLPLLVTHVTQIFVTQMLLIKRLVFNLEYFFKRRLKCQLEKKSDSDSVCHYKRVLSPVACTMWHHCTPVSFYGLAYDRVLQLKHTAFSQHSQNMKLVLRKDPCRWCFHLSQRNAKHQSIKMKSNVSFITEHQWL